MVNLKDKIKQILFDADDTLWENNIYYLEANHNFFDLLAQGGFSEEEVAEEFDKLELKVINERGYGSINYIYILEELFNKYNKLAGGKLDADRLRDIIARFKEHPLKRPQVFEKVEETLRYLRERYKLYILTKGDDNEQSGKIVRSGLDQLVDDYFVLPEKSDEEYKAILKKFNWTAAETCMVGNSPKSDVNPALRCGMYAVYIPYRETWKVDLEPIVDQQQRLIVLKSFAELKTVL